MRNFLIILFCFFALNSFGQYTNGAGQMVQMTLDGKLPSVDGSNVTGIAKPPVYALLSNGSTAMAFGTNTCVKVTPNATASYTTTIPAAGTICTLIILTSGTTSYTITFGSGFKPVSTIVSGTTTAKTFTIMFISDGSTLIETGRTTAH